MELRHQSHRWTWNSPCTSLMYREQWPLVLVDRCFLYGITLSAEVLQPDSAPAPAIISLGLWHPPVFLVLHCAPTWSFAWVWLFPLVWTFNSLVLPSKVSSIFLFQTQRSLKDSYVAYSRSCLELLTHTTKLTFPVHALTAVQAGYKFLIIPQCLLWWLLRSIAVHSDASEGFEALGVNSYGG